MQFFLRSLIIWAIFFGASAQGAAQNTWRNAGGIPVLTYHRFDPGKAASTTVTTHTFIMQLDTLSREGYRIVPIQEVVDMVAAHSSPRQQHEVAVTVDDGHASVYSILFPIIHARKIPITLFIYPSIISKRSDALTWRQLHEMQDTGLVRIESHTYWHPDFRREKRRMTPGDYKKFVHSQLLHSRETLETNLGAHVSLLAWPYGIHDADLEDAAKDAGYLAAFAFDSKIATPQDARYAIHRIPVSEDMHGEAFLKAFGQYSQGRESQDGQRR